MVPNSVSYCRAKPLKVSQYAVSGSAPTPQKGVGSGLSVYRVAHSQQRVFQAGSGRTTFCTRIAQALGFSRAEVRGCELLRVGLGCGVDIMMILVIIVLRCVPVSDAGRDDGHYPYPTRGGLLDDELGRHLRGDLFDVPAPFMITKTRVACTATGAREGGDRGGTMRRQVSCTPW